MKEVAAVQEAKQCDDGERSMEKKEEDIQEKEARGSMNRRDAESRKNKA